MSRLSTAILLGCFAISTVSLHAQDIKMRTVYGDSTLKSVVAPQTRAIYDQGGEWTFILTKENPLHVQGPYATELQATLFEGHFNRAIVTVWTSDGKYNIEIYFNEEALIFTYETFEYFKESAPKHAWHNFKGIAAWERRSYFKGQAIGYGETRGEVHIKQDSASLIAASTRVRSILKEGVQ